MKRALLPYAALCLLACRGQDKPPEQPGDPFEPVPTPMMGSTTQGGIGGMATVTTGGPQMLPARGAGGTNSAGGVGGATSIAKTGTVRERTQATNSAIGSTAMSETTGMGGVHFTPPGPDVDSVGHFREPSANSRD